jgi:hypothetical protein
MPRKSLWEPVAQDNLTTSLQRISNDNTPRDPGFEIQKRLIREKGKVGNWKTITHIYKADQVMYR